MHVPSLLKRLREATTLLEAYDLSESEHYDLVQRAHTKVAEVARSLEANIKETYAHKEAHEAHR